MSIQKRLGQIKRSLTGNSVGSAHRAFYRRFMKYAFIEGECSNAQQFEASITKMYHAVEKGLSYPVYRPNFGKKNVLQLIASMEAYAAKYDVTAFFYETSLSVLTAYNEKNRQAGSPDPEIEKRVAGLPGKANGVGGVITVNALSEEQIKQMDHARFVESRHSIRFFDPAPFPVEKIHAALALAQYTPSACNRQGWKAHIVNDSAKVQKILANQNGNKGFGEAVKQLVVVTGDLRYFNKTRELHQVYIDGGMYAMRVLDALHYEGAATTPLSAALTGKQEENVRKLLDLDPAEVIIMFICVGTCPAETLTTRSERRPYRRG